jgi:hypothetical protein
MAGTKFMRTKVRRLKIKQKAVANLEAELLRRVRADDALSRVDLARELNLAPSTVGGRPKSRSAFCHSERNPSAMSRST